MKKSDLKRLVRGIVAAQGNAFIRELLREKGLPITGTKDVFVERLEAAIENDDLTHDDVEEWLARVEGWGNFHIYPRVIPPAVVRSKRWTAPELQRRLGSKAASLWDAPTSHLFPDSLTLTHVSFSDKTFRVTWHQRGSTRHRAEQFDDDFEVDGDKIIREAYLIRPERRVVRFQISLTRRIGAIFVPYPIKESSHSDALHGVWDTVADIIAEEECPAFDLPRVIRAADQAQLSGAGELRSKSARLTIQDGWLELGSAVGPYAEIDELREVRLAAGGDAFSGARATFLYAPVNDPQRRDLTVSLSGRDARVWVPAQLEETQVWNLVSHLLEFAQ